MFRSIDFIKRLDRSEPSLRQVMLIVLLITAVSLWFRAPSLLLNPSLWAEDESQFIRGVLLHGAGSIIMPPDGPGYHTLFQRLVASSLLVLPLKYAEIIFHSVSLVVLYFATLIAWIFLPVRSFFARLTASTAIFFVPLNANSIFLNLVNTQWILGAILSLVVVSDFEFRSRFKFAWYAVLAVLCLTGPFAVLSLPLLIVRMIVRRDLRKEAFFYFATLVPILVQVATLYSLAGSRLTQLKASTSFADWYEGIVTNTLLRLASGWLYLFMFSAFLIFVIFALVRAQSRQRSVVVLSLLAVSAINIAAGFYSYKYMPEAVGPFGAGERYFYIPGLLLFFFLLTASEGWSRPIAIGAIFAVCVANVAPIAGGPEGRGPTFWLSHVALSRYAKETYAEARPVWPTEVFKNVIYNNSPERVPVSLPLAIADFHLEGLNIEPYQEGWLIQSKTLNPSANLLGANWNSSNVTVSDRKDGLKVDVRGKDNSLFQSFPANATGGRLRFSFEAQSDSQISIHPHLTNYRSGKSFVANLGANWREFIFETTIAPGISPQNGVYLLLNSDSIGSFQVRNTRASIEPLEPRFMQIKVPEICAAQSNVAFSYLSSEAPVGFHEMIASSTDDFDGWKTQHRPVGAEPKEVIFAVPNSGMTNLRIFVEPPVKMSDLKLRCY